MLGIWHCSRRLLCSTTSAGIPKWCGASVTTTVDDEVLDNGTLVAMPVGPCTWDQRSAPMRLAAVRRHRHHHPKTHLALREWDNELHDEIGSSSELSVPTTTVAERVQPRGQHTLREEEADDDVVVEPYNSDVLQAHWSMDNIKNNPDAERSKLRAAAQHRVGADVLALVTDEFRTLREREVQRRRTFLYNLTHPVVTDYTYAGKLLPPPPLAFGRIPEESVQLGTSIMLEQHYTKVRSAPSSSYFFEINDLYMEIVMVGRANAGKSSLINALLGQPELAKTSSTPNCTREVTFYQSVSPEQLNNFANRNPNKLVKLPGGGMQLTFVDLPGFGIEGMSEAWRDNAIACTDSYLGTRRSVNTVLFCIDCAAGLTKTDVKYMEWLENLHGVFWIILTKCDTVPHSRVCSVMRQVYALITKYRRKYRKAFPFVLPVSSRDGTNLEALRGLIAETSGMVPGDRLRKMLYAKAKQAATEAEQLEEGRLWELWNANRAEARKHFLAGRTLRGRRSRGTSRFKLDAGEEAPTRNVPPPAVVRRQCVTLQLSSREKPASLECGTDIAASTKTTHPRERVALPYGGARIKINDGFVDDVMEVEFDKNGEEEEENSVEEEGKKCLGPPGNGEDAPAAAPLLPTERTGGGGGRVTQYLDTLEAMSRAVSKSQLRKMRRQGKAGTTGDDAFPPSRSGASVVCKGPWRGGSSPYVEAATNITPRRNRKNTIRDALRVPHAQRATSSLADTDDGVEQSSVCHPTAEWRARRYATLAHSQNPEAPWEALPALKKKEEDLRQRAAVSKMSKKELESYLKTRGAIISGFDRFENEVTMSKYMTETRNAKTLRQKSQWELNASDKINYRSQPPGLFKAYGEKGSFKPTSRILGVE